MLSHRGAENPLALALVMMVEPALLPSKIEFSKGVALLSPQRVMRVGLQSGRTTTSCDTATSLALVAEA